MKKKIIPLLAVAAAIALSGCGAGERSAGTAVSESASAPETIESTEAGAWQEENDAAMDTAEATADDPYAAFLLGEKGIRFSYYMENVYREDLPSYADDTIAHIPADGEYTLSELTGTLNEIFDNEEYYYADGEVSRVEYSYLDCGADGEKELALLMAGPFVEPESELTLIIKDMEDDLQVVYAFTTWSRSFTEITEYGLVSGDGSNGASNHGYHESYLNGDGVFQYGFYEEQEFELSMFAFSQGKDDFQEPELEGKIIIYSLRLGEYSEENAEPQFYSYEVLDKDTYDVLDIPNLYTDSPYQKVMDSFEGITVIPMTELQEKERERMEALGVTEAISTGRELTFTEISENSEASLADILSEPSSVQEEMAEVEERSKEIENRDWDYMPQQEMNMTSGEWYRLWDDELNDLWGRIMEEIDPGEKDAMIQEQKNWIEEKEAAVTDAGQEALGGTLQPLLENGTAMRYTRKRAYDLAAVLAEIRGESFSVPPEVEESFQEDF